MKQQMGEYCRGGVVHLAAPFRKVKDYKGEDYQLYRAACRRGVMRRQVTHLLLLSGPGIEVTCKRCQALLAGSDNARR